ncbi:MAG: DM13 domain-containing protein [Acidimicrobiia bacterium]|nr:DM13 domain-containing protein [Acidimicrobiia bacterium]
MRLVRFLLGLSTRVKVAVAVVIVGLGVFVIAYFEPHKLFIDEVVDEAFPAPIATTAAAAEATPATAAPTTTTPPTTTAPDDPATTTAATTQPTAIEPEPGPDSATEDPPVTTTSTTTAAVTTTTAAPTTTTTAAPTTTTTVPEGPVLLSVSEWISIGHPGTGTVLVYRQPDGSHVVRFEDLDVSNGPDLLVILSAAPLVDDRAAYSEVAYLSLGDLKGNQGNQNYIVPAEVNLDEYQTVAIWCRRFNYTFNAAEIHSPPA